MYSITNWFATTPIDRVVVVGMGLIVFIICAYGIIALILSYRLELNEYDAAVKYLADRGYTFKRKQMFDGYLLTTYFNGESCSTIKFESGLPWKEGLLEGWVDAEKEIRYHIIDRAQQMGSTYGKSN